jgi:hypothetical protein
MKTVKIYTGESVEHLCGQELHPKNAVLKAQELVLSEYNVITYSNNPDFISAIKYIAKKHKIEAEFFLNGISTGNSIEPLFEDFNRSLDLINELGNTEI